MSWAYNSLVRNKDLKMSGPFFDPKLLADLKNSMADLLEDSDWASELLPDFDYASQLVAIDALIERNKAAGKAQSERIKGLADAIATANSYDSKDWAEGAWIDAMHYSVYHDAATSMAALGMIAPFLETLFVRVFATIGAKERVSRAMRTALNSDDFWNCRFAWSNRDGRREDLALGIWQLAEVTELHLFLPADLRSRLESLFAYRNHMFHNGMEWPKEARSRFFSRIESQGWHSHFSIATTNDEPWVIYLSDAGIEWWLRALPDVLSGVGRYFKERVRPAIRETTSHIKPES